MANFSVRQWVLLFVLLGVVLCLPSTPQREIVAQRQPANNPVQQSNLKGDDPTQKCPETEPLRKNVQQLTAEVQRLKRRVADLEKDRLATTIQEQLEKEEQRGETSQLHLLEIAEKEAPLQARMDQINQQLRPEALERTMAGVGSVHPEDAREEVRRRLTSERMRLVAQLDLLRQDRVRTQSTLATTDAAIQRLKQKLAEALRP